MTQSGARAMQGITSEAFDEERPGELPRVRYDRALGKLTPEYRRLWDWLAAQDGFRSGRRTIRVVVKWLALELRIDSQVAWRAVKRLRELGLLHYEAGEGTRNGTPLSAPAWVAELLAGGAPPVERDLLARADEHRSSPPRPPDPGPTSLSIPTSTSTLPRSVEAEAERQLKALASHARETAPASAPVRTRDESSPASIPSPSAKSSPLPSQGSRGGISRPTLGMVLKRMGSAWIEAAAKGEPKAIAPQPPLPEPAEPAKPRPPTPQPVAVRDQVEGYAAALEAALGGAGVDPWIFRWVALECCDARIPGLSQGGRLTRSKVDGIVAAARGPKTLDAGAYFVKALRKELSLRERRWPWWKAVKPALAEVAGVEWNPSWQHGRSRKKAR